MQVQNNNSPSFGQIFYRNILTRPTYFKKVTEGPINERTLGAVLRSDYDMPELKNRYNQLLAEQKNNPVNICIDFLRAEGYDGPDLFQIAKVGGRTFKQRTIYIPELEPRPSTIKFLERACRWANLLKFFGITSKNSEYSTIGIESSSL